MFRNERFTTIRAGVLGCASTLALCLASPAVAQAPAAAAAAQDEAEEIIVITGSRVRGAAPVGSTVISVGRTDIEDSGEVTLDRMLKDIPQVFDLGVSENSRGQAGGAGNIVYGNTVNLRGIGPYATLVLVDGHRVVNNSRSTDPSILPTLGVERVEVVADGASAIYGSDAVAGVVNLIPRRSLDGAEITGRYGMSEDGAFDESSYGAAIGKVWSGGQAMIAWEHVERSNLSGDDRDFFRSDQTASGGNNYSVTRCDPGTIRIGTTTYAIPAGGLTAANAGSLVAGTVNRCNELTGQDLFPEQSYDSINVTASQDLSSAITLFFDGFYSNREFVRRSGYSLGTFNVPSTNAFFVRPPGFTGTSYTIDYSFADDLPSNDATGYGRSFQLSPGVRVALPFDWRFEGVASYGETKDNSSTLSGVGTAALNAALASSDPTTAFDPYGLHRTNPTVLANIANQIFVAPTLNDFSGLEARFDGPLFSLPAGEVKLAVGYERQDQNVGLGSARGGPTAAMTFRYFDRQVESYYAEVFIPVFGGSATVPGFQRLELNAAIRSDSYSDVGDTTNPKFGVNWEPVHGLLFKASYGTSFRAPLITQIYGNSNNMFAQSYQNPLGGATLPGIALSGANLDLKPEEATTWSAGVEWEPTSTIRLGATYFDVEYINQVDAYLSNLAILSLESDFAGTGVILRGTEARDRVLQLLSQGVTLAAGTFPGGSPNNVTLFVDGRSRNLGTSRTKGIDFTGSWEIDTDAMGTFTLNGSGTYFTDYAVSLTPAGRSTDRLNTIFNPLQFKMRGSLTWDHGPARVQFSGNYVNAYTNNAVTPNQEVDSHITLDLSGNWRFGDQDAEGFLASGFNLGLEVRNLLDEEPPYVNLAPSVNGSGGYDATVGNPIGRLYAVSLRKSF